MSSVALSGNVGGTGVLTLAAPNTNTNRTLTLPDETGTILTNASTVRTQKGVPAFSAYQSVAQSFTNAAMTRIQYNAENYDVTNAFDNTTNYRFQPTTAGYYIICASLYFNTGGSGNYLGIYKNGSEISRSAYIGANTFGMLANTTCYLNGSTDYIDFWATQNGGTQNSNNSPNVTSVNGILVAAA